MERKEKRLKTKSMFKKTPQRRQSLKKESKELTKSEKKSKIKVLGKAKRFVSSMAKRMKESSNSPKRNPDSVVDLVSNRAPVSIRGGGEVFVADQPVPSLRGGGGTRAHSPPGSDLAKIAMLSPKSYAEVKKRREEKLGTSKLKSQKHSRKLSKNMRNVEKELDVMKKAKKGKIRLK